MAEEYWNRGRREGIQQSSALDTLERVLGIGSNIAGRVQANRDRRRGLSLKSIDYMTRGFENEYVLEKLNNLNSQLDTYRSENQKDWDVDTHDLYKLKKDSIQNHIDGVEKFNSTYNNIVNLGKQGDDWLEDMFTWSGLSSDARKDLILKKETDASGVLYSDNYEAKKKEDFIKHIEDYTKSKEDFILTGGQRVNLVADKMANIENVLRTTLDVWNTQGKITSAEYNALDDAVITGNYAKVNRLRNAQEKDNLSGQTLLFNQLTKETANYEKNKELLEKKSIGVKYKNMPSTLQESYMTFYFGPEGASPDPEEEMVVTLDKDVIASLIGTPESPGENPELGQFAHSLRMNILDEMGISKTKINNLNESYLLHSGVDYVDEYNFKLYAEKDEGSKPPIEETGKDLIEEKDKVEVKKDKEEIKKPADKVEAEKKTKVVSKEAEGRKKRILSLRNSIAKKYRKGASGGAPKGWENKVGSLQTELSSEIKKLEKLGFYVTQFGKLTPIKTPEEYRKDIEESIHKMQFPPTIKMMGDRYISGEPVTPEQEILMGKKWKKQRPRD